MTVIERRREREREREREERVEREQTERAERERERVKRVKRAEKQQSRIFINCNNGGHLGTDGAPRERGGERVGGDREIAESEREQNTSYWGRERERGNHKQLCIYYDCGDYSFLQLMA